MSAAPHFRRASLAASYPDPETRAALAQPVTEDGDDAGAPDLDAAARAGDDLESDYIELFDLGARTAPLHGTGFGRGQGSGLGDRLADVAAFYRAFGVEIAGSERPDHLAVELEFYAWLLLKAEHLEAIGDREGVEVVLDARRKFLAEPLGPAALLPSVVAHPVFGPRLAWISDLVGRECAALGVEAEPREPAPGPEEPESFRCAAAPDLVTLSGRRARAGAARSNAPT
jgi:nitrate reductase assembly molybdenum cofactor insertion protein NarJ